MIKTLSLFCLLAIIIGFAPLSHAAEASTQMAHSDGDVDANSHDIVQGSHVEGHIAFLRAELGITAAQESQWQSVAAAMREDVRNLDEAERRVARKQEPENTLAYLQNRVMFANLRAQGEQRFLTAFQPLYEILSPQQRHVADELLIPSAPQ